MPLCIKHHAVIVGNLIIVPYIILASNKCSIAVVRSINSHVAYIVYSDLAVQIRCEPTQMLLIILIEINQFYPLVSFYATFGCIFNDLA